MKKQAPFVGEEFFARDGETTKFGDDTELLDELLNAELENSSWDDLVAPEAKARKPQVRASIEVPASVKKNTPALPEATIDWRPINHGHSIRVNIHGNITIDMMRQWRQLMRETDGNGIHQFEFDLRDTESMSLAGLAMLLLFKDNKHAGSRDICLSQCSQQLYKRLLWSGLTKEFIVRPRQ